MTKRTHSRATVHFGVPLTPAAFLMRGLVTSGPAMLWMTLFCFAPTPRDLMPGDEFLIEDRLWSEAHALGSLEVEGQDGCRLEALPRGDPVFPPACEDEARVFKARCLSPPQPKKPT